MTYDNYDDFESQPDADTPEATPGKRVKKPAMTPQEIWQVTKRALAIAKMQEERQRKAQLAAFDLFADAMMVRHGKQTNMPSLDRLAALPDYEEEQDGTCNELMHTPPLQSPKALPWVYQGEK